VNAAERKVRAALVALSDSALVRLYAELAARKPGAPKPAVGVRPRRRPWTYIEMWRLAAAEDEIRRRGL
jgi:hypothetical protein